MKRMYSEEELQDIIKSLIESGTIENAKPIYCHPITIIKTGNARLTALIFNNSATPFTWTTFKQWLAAATQEQGIIRIMVSGGYLLAPDNLLVSSYFYYDLSGERYYLYGLTGTDAGAVVDFTAFTPDLFNDGVNKIN